MILIRSAKVVDGTGKPAYMADVLTQGNKIAGIGYFPAQKAEIVIDGINCHLTPGFIDIHTDIDHNLSLFTNPEQPDYLLQGVTTVIGGNCGSSLAPLLYGGLESIQKWGDTNQINVDWHTLEEFFVALKKIKLGINFGTLIGHSTIRRSLLGEQLRDLTDNELQIFKNILERALEDGALGFSTGLSYAHARQTPYQEIKFLAALVKNYNGIYATHLRSESTALLASARETLSIAQETGARTIISHFRPLLGHENNFQEALKLINDSKNDISVDIYPADVSLLPLYKFLPAWAQNGGLGLMVDRLLDERIAQRVAKELTSLKKTDIAIAAAPGNEFLAGKNIGELAKDYGAPIGEALVRVMIVTRLKALALYKNINFDLVKELLAHPKALISSNSALLKEKPFLKFLELTRNTLSLEQAIQKITSAPARKFGIKNRGTVAVGNFADLVLLKNNHPETVLLNGQVAVKDGVYQKVRAGEVIRH